MAKPNQHKQAEKVKPEKHLWRRDNDNVKYYKKEGYVKSKNDNDIVKDDNNDNSFVIIASKPPVLKNRNSSQNRMKTIKKTNEKESKTTTNKQRMVPETPVISTEVEKLEIDKTDHPIIAKKTDQPIFVKKTDQPIVVQKTNQPINGKKTDQPIVGKKTDQPINAKKADQLIIVKKTDRPIIAKKTYQPINVRKTNQPIIAKKTDQPIIVKKTDQPINGEKTDQLIIVKITDQPIIAKKTDQPINVKKTNQPIIAKKTDQPINGKKTDQPINGKKTNQPIIAKKTDQPINAKKADQPINAKKTDQPINGKKTNQPIIAKKTDQPINAKKADQPINAKKTDQPINVKRTERRPNTKKTMKPAIIIKNKKPPISKKFPMKGKGNPVSNKNKKQTKTNNTEKQFVEKAVGRDEGKEERVKKDSISQMASLLDESNIPPFEKQSGIFEEIKDKTDKNQHTIVGGRSKFKHRDSLNLYKDGFQPGHSMVYYPSNNMKTKKHNHGFHLSLNESTMSFLNTSDEYLEMSSGLVVNNTKPNHAFHISLDDLNNSKDYNSQSGMFIKNKIFNSNNEWDIEKTSPGRINKQDLSVNQTNTAIDEGTPFTNLKDSLSIPKKDRAPLSRNSTRLSFLYNRHTGFICKHCFNSNCEHMEKITPLTSPHKEQTVSTDEINETKNNEVMGIEKKIEERTPDNSVQSQNDQKSKRLEEQELSESLDDIETEILLENIREKLNKNSRNSIELNDLLKVIKLKEVYHEDNDGKMVAYKEFVLDFDNSTTSDISLGDDVEKELLNLSFDETTLESIVENNLEIHDDNNESELDISGSALRTTPIIKTEQRLPPISKNDLGAKQISNDSMLYYDSDYDDASYLNACALSKSNASFEKYDLKNDLFFANIESDREKTQHPIREKTQHPMLFTPPLQSSSPSQPLAESQQQSQRRKRQTLLSTSELQTVFETEEANHRSPRCHSNQSDTGSNKSRALTNVTANLDDLIDFADNVLDSRNEEDASKHSSEEPTRLTSLESEKNSIENDQINNMKHSSDESTLDYHTQLPNPNNNPDLNEQDHLQMWLQDVNKYREENNQVLTTEQFDSKNEKSEDIETNTSNSNQLNSDVDELEINTSYKHIDVLVLESRGSVADFSTIPGNSERSVVDSGVGSHGTEHSKTSIEVRREQEQLSNLSQQPRFTHNITTYNRDSESQDTMQHHKQLSHFTNPNRNYNMYLQSYTNNTAHTHFHNPKPPTHVKPISRTFKRHFSASLIKSNATDSYLNKLNSISMARGKPYIRRLPDHRVLPDYTTSLTYHQSFTRNDQELSVIMLDEQRSNTNQSDVIMTQEQRLPSLSPRYKTLIPDMHRYGNMISRDYNNNYTGRKRSISNRRKHIEMNNKDTTLYLTAPYLTSSCQYII